MWFTFKIFFGKMCPYTPNDPLPKTDLPNCLKRARTLNFRAFPKDQNLNTNSYMNTVCRTATQPSKAFMRNGSDALKRRVKFEKFILLVNRT